MSIAPYEGTGGFKDIDPGTAAQGHVSQKTKQEFTLLKQRKVECRKLNLQAEEFLYRDQFGNCYTTHRAMLPDGEIYDVTAYFGKQLSHTGEITTVREWKNVSAKYDDAVVDAIRDNAFVQLGRAVVAIMKARQAEGAQFVLSADEAAAAAEGIVTSIMAPASDDAPSAKPAAAAPVAPQILDARGKVAETPDNVLPFVLPKESKKKI